MLKFMMDMYNKLQMISSNNKKSLLFFLLCVIFLQASFLHQIKHSIENEESPCLVCLTQAELGTGQITEALDFEIKQRDIHFFNIPAPQFKLQNIKWHRNRSPPLIG